MGSAYTYVLKQLASLEDVDDFVAASHEWEDGSTVAIDASRLFTTYPNATVYFAACMEYLLLHRAIKCKPIALHDKQKMIHIFSPMTVERYVEGDYPTNEVWKYASESEADFVTRKFMRSIEDLIPCEVGVLDTLNWCIYEVLDNVFQHSHSPVGYAMMQLHVTNRTCVISVADPGRGIHRAMVDGVRKGLIDGARVLRASDAIEYSLQRGVTSKGRDNQGNGLHGLRSAVELNGGLLEVTSGKGSWRFESGSAHKENRPFRPLLDGENYHSTVVDWRLNCGRPVAIHQALGAPISGGSYINSLVDEDGVFVITTEEVERHIGSRGEGRELATRVRNALMAGAEYVLLDLTGVQIVSSSFADEVFGKLAEELGEANFKSRIFQRGAREANISLIQRAIATRLGHSG